MQEIIIERLIQSLAQWFSNLDFTLSKQNDKLSLICKELNIKIENLPREEFITAVIEKGTDGLEKLFNLKALGIDLKDFFGVKKQEKTEQPKPSAKEQEKPFDVENWIREELKKEFQHEKLVPRENSHEHFQKIIREQQTPINPLNPFQNWPNPFPWNQVICLVG